MMNKFVEDNLPIFSRIGKISLNVGKMDLIGQIFLLIIIVSTFFAMGA